MGVCVGVCVCVCVWVCGCVGVWVCGCLRKEGYIKCTDGPETVTATVRKAIQANGWEDNPDGCLATLYLIGKAKSLLKAQWLWRPIAALPQPLLKRDLKVAARATTALLRLLAEGIPGNSMVHSVNRVADWFIGWTVSDVHTWLSCIVRTNSTMFPPPKLPPTSPRVLTGLPNGAAGAARKLFGASIGSQKGWTGRGMPTLENFGF